MQLRCDHHSICISPAQIAADTSLSHQNDDEVQVVGSSHTSYISYCVISSQCWNGPFGWTYHDHSRPVRSLSLIPKCVDIMVSHQVILTSRFHRRPPSHLTLKAAVPHRTNRVSVIHSQLGAIKQVVGTQISELLSLGLVRWE